MKIRTGFVSNSSSSSFTIKKCNLSIEQLYLIKNHSIHGIHYNIYYGESDAWAIDIDEIYLNGCTGMDNFDMREYLKLIGVRDEYIEWN